MEEFLLSELGERGPDLDWYWEEMTRRYQKRALEAMVI